VLALLVGDPQADQMNERGQDGAGADDDEGACGEPDQLRDHHTAPSLTNAAPS